MSKLNFGNNSRSLFIVSAIRIELVTIIWMLIEGAASIFAGIISHSTSLTAFGADSIIELIAGAILLWRLQTEKSGQSDEVIDRAERIASWVTASALAGLCLYVIVESCYGLLTGETQETSFVGIVIAIAALLIMLPLATKKRRLAKELNSAALRADAACSMTCVYMAGALLTGLIVNAFTGWRWVDDAVSLVFLFWLIPETKEAFEGAKRGEIRCDCG